MSANANGGSSAGTIRVTLVRSTIGRPKDQELTVRSIGIKRMHQTVEVLDTPAMRGQINKIRHLVEIEEANG